MTGFVLSVVWICFILFSSEKLGAMKDRQRVALQYNEKLKEKYGQHPKVCSILPLNLFLLILFLP